MSKTPSRDALTFTIDQLVEVVRVLWATLDGSESDKAVAALAANHHALGALNGCLGQNYGGGSWEDESLPAALSLRQLGGETCGHLWGTCERVVGHRGEHRSCAACESPSGYHDDGDPMLCSLPAFHDGDHAHYKMFTWELGTLASDGDPA